MPISYTNIHQTYRRYLPSGHYECVIVSLVHQKADMVYYMAKNIEKYVKGNFIWIVHYNNSDPIDENKLPPWVWLVRATIQTMHGTRLLAHGVAKCLEFAVHNVTFTNVLCLSSGSAFYRDFIIPVIPKICIQTHETVFDRDLQMHHHSAIPIGWLGCATDYLAEKGRPPWQYNNFDKDSEAHGLIVRRKFTHTRGCQLSGQMWPYEVAVQLVEDMRKLEYMPVRNYCPEEIYFSTYASNFAERNGLPIERCEVIINWNNHYSIDDIEYVKRMESYGEKGSALCKVNEDLSSAVRVYINRP